MGACSTANDDALLVGVGCSPRHSLVKPHRARMRAIALRHGESLYGSDVAVANAVPLMSSGGVDDIRRSRSTRTR